MNEADLIIPLPPAAAPAPEAARTNVTSTTAIRPLAVQPVANSLGRRIITTLEVRLRDLIGRTTTAATDGHAYGVVEVGLLSRLRAGEPDPAIATRLARLMSDRQDSEASKIARGIADLLSRPDTPCRLLVSTAEILTGLSEGTLRGPVRKGELHPQILKGRLYYDATELEHVLRRHYSGDPTVDGEERTLLLEPKCGADQQAAARLNVCVRVLQMLIGATLLQSIRVGTTTVLLRSDLERLAALSGAGRRSLG